MNEYRYNKDTHPDPVVARDGYFFPVIQYKGGVGKIVYPADSGRGRVHGAMIRPGEPKG